jgi:GntR family transcriptional regulator, rspAB operon transcriptional repressor
MTAKSTLSVRSKSGLIANARADSLASKAYEQIRNEILQGNLAMGDILSRRRLAAQLNMSFLPITEAMQRLEMEGLVESRPRIGTRVRIPTEQDVRNSYVIREALESQAARMCCERMTPAEREQLKKSAQHLDSLYKASASENADSRFLFSVHLYHMQFHMRIAELAQSSGLLKAIEKEQVLIFNWLYDLVANRTSLPANFHYDLATALCSGEVLKADQEMRRHIDYGLDNLVESLGKLDGSNGWRLKRGNKTDGAKKS